MLFRIATFIFLKRPIVKWVAKIRSSLILIGGFSGSRVLPSRDWKTVVYLVLSSKSSLLLYLFWERTLRSYSRFNSPPLPLSLRPCLSLFPWLCLWISISLFPLSLSHFLALPPPPPCPISCYLQDRLSHHSASSSASASLALGLQVCVTMMSWAFFPFQRTIVNLS